MPNTTGGKNYKKSKHSSGLAPAFIDRQPDQMYARIIKVLGNRNLLAYCNDNKIRLCHIRGTMRKKVWINIGDIVLVSMREFEKDVSQTGKQYEKADVVAKYDMEHLNKLKKMEDVNKKLFMQLETADGSLLAEIGKREDIGNTERIEDFGIEFEGEATQNGNEKEESSDEELDIDDI